MRPYSERSKLKDNNLHDQRPHPHHKWLNWWEFEIQKVKNKKSIRQKIKNLLNKESKRDEI